MTAAAAPPQQTKPKLSLSLPRLHRIVRWATVTKIYPVFSYKIQNSKKKFRHLHEDLNLDEIKKRIAQFACKLRDESNDPN